MGDIRLYGERGGDRDEKSVGTEEREGFGDVVSELWKGELTCPAVYPPLPQALHLCRSTIPLTSCEFKQLSFCAVIPNALK